MNFLLNNTSNERLITDQKPGIDNNKKLDATHSLRNHQDSGKLDATHSLRNHQDSGKLDANLEKNIMRKVLTFFKEEYNLNQMLPIICGTSDICLRVLEWFVVRYAKDYNISYQIKKSNITREFSVSNSYKAQLKTYSKKGFDPCCRGETIYFEYTEDEGIETTVCQLNFFKWAIENKIIDYVKNNLQQITEDMKNRSHKEKGAKKRNLSITGAKYVDHKDVKITLKFDL